MFDLIEVNVQKCNKNKNSLSKTVFAYKNEDGSVDIFEDRLKTFLITTYPAACGRKPTINSPTCVYNFTEYFVCW